MNCPVCLRTLTSIKFGELEVDVCKGGCGGVWFDRFEFKQVDEPTEKIGEALLKIERDPKIQVDFTAKRKCPKDQTLMMQHFSSSKRKVVIDECPKCAGVWLDVGELATIRNEYSSETERQKAQQTYFSEVFGQQLKELENKRKTKESMKNKIAQFMKELFTM